MKATKFILLFLGIYITSYCQVDVMPYWQKNPTRFEIETKLKKDLGVKKVTVKTISLDSIGNSIDSIFNFIEYRDEFGNRVKFDAYNDKGIFVEYVTWKFDSLNREIEYCFYKADSVSFVLRDKYLYNYDAKNQMFYKEIVKQWKNSTGYVLHKFNERGLTTNTYSVNKGNNFDSTAYVNCYDENDSLISSIRYRHSYEDYTNKWENSIDTTYPDSKHLPLETITFTPKGNVFYWEDGSNGKKISFEFKYDNNENLLSKKKLVNRELVYTETYYYFPNGLLKSENFQSHGKQHIIIYQYEYYD